MAVNIGSKVAILKSIISEQVLVLLVLVRYSISPLDWLLVVADEFCPTSNRDFVTVSLYLCISVSLYLRVCEGQARWSLIIPIFKSEEIV